MAKYGETRAFGTVVLGWGVQTDGIGPTAFRFTWTAAVATPNHYRIRNAGPLWKVERFHEASQEWYVTDWRSPSERAPDDPLMAEIEGIYPTEAGALEATLAYLGAAIERKQQTLDGYRARHNALVERLRAVAPETAGVA